MKSILDFIAEKGVSLVRLPDMNSNHSNQKYIDWVKTGVDSDKKIDFPQSFDKLFNDQCSGEEITSYELLFKLEQLYKVRAHYYLEAQIATPISEITIS